MRTLSMIWIATPEELRVLLLSYVLFLLYFLLNVLVTHTHGDRYSPYFHVLYNDKFKSDPNHSIAFGITVSFAFLIAILISYLILLFLRMISDHFSYKNFAIYSIVGYVVSIFLNMIYAKKKLGLPLINRSWWQDLGADIRKRAHENMEKNKKDDINL